MNPLQQFRPQLLSRFLFLYAARMDDMRQNAPVVAGVVLRKMDKCMRDLADFHSIRLQPGESLQQQQQPQEPLYLPRLANNIQPTPALMRALSTERRAERSSLL